MPTINRNIRYQQLAARRLKAAEHRLRCYDFGGDVVAFGEWSQLGREGGQWRRPVRLQLDQDVLDVVFAITFAAGTNHMIEAYAVAASGAPLLVGKWSDDILREAVMARQSRPAGLRRRPGGCG
ncbi:MAG: hypothetical protein EON47_08490 [Acetobacteraceae bacterium]|nr:MAG: hypothetical protein EON47_08490 [Acetobacteraceae bacterium]